MAHSVFICHSSKDKLTADAACAALEAQRIRCWIAPRDILAGVEYGEAIIEGITNCQIVLLIFSADANNSPQVRREIERAVSKGKIIVPFRLEDVLPNGAMEYALSNTHWLDALTPPIENRLHELWETIRRLLKKHPGDPLWASKAADAAHKAAAHAETPCDSGIPQVDAPPPEQVRTCPRCGKECPEKNQFCPADGTRLGEPHAKAVQSQQGPSQAACAQLEVWAKPKVDIGALNQLDTNSVAVEINGASFEMAWGHRSFQVPPGTCRVRVGIRSPMLSGLRSACESVLNLKPGETGTVRYTSGLTLFQGGTLTVDSPPVVTTTAQAAPPGRKPCVRCQNLVPMMAIFCSRCGCRQT